MVTNKLRKKLERFFAFDGDKQQKKQDKLHKIIDKLAENKAKLAQELSLLADSSANNERRTEIQMEMEVIAQLIKKAQSSSENT